MKYDVFISYSRKDSEIADEICRSFDKCNITYFIDRERITGGDDYLQKIADNLDNSNHLLFLASKNSYLSEYANKEIHYFFEKNKDKKSHRIIPYVIDDTAMPNKLAFLLGTINRIFINDCPIETLTRDILLTLLNGESVSKPIGAQERNDISNRPRKLTLSYFSGERFSDHSEQIIQIAQQLGYSTQIYDSRTTTQFDFLKAVFQDTVTIVDGTIPDDISLSTVYPILTAHVNVLEHILVFSDKYYDDGSQILPLNIEPQRKRTNEDKDLITWLIIQLKDLGEHEYYERFEIESIDKLLDYKEQMERVMEISLSLHKMNSEAKEESEKTKVLISYRNSYSKEVDLFKKQEEAKGNVEIKMLPPGSLCDDFEANTPMRRWMLVGILEDHIRCVNEVWVYYNNTYTDSWWTLAEMVMVSYINHSLPDDAQIKIKVYDANRKRFLDKNENGYPSFLHIHLKEEQYQKITRYLANTRPDSMGPETLQQINGLRKVAWVLRLMPKKKKNIFIEQLRPMLDNNVPSLISIEERNKMVNELLAMYSSPRKLKAYTNEPVFKNKFWNNISHQTSLATGAFNNYDIDVDCFINTPMREITTYTDDKLRKASSTHSQIELRGKKYYVSEGKRRYLWLATRMGMPTVKDAPGIEIIQTYNLLTPNQIVGLVMLKLL